MKQPFLNKLGTILNTLGSLGTGYYVAKFGIYADPTPALLNLSGLDNAKLIVCVAMLLAGLFLRWSDILQQTKTVTEIVNRVESKHNQVNELQARLDDLKSVFEIAINDVVTRKIQEAFIARDATKQKMAPMSEDQ